ncbi:thymidylate synthase [uncultured phage]|nr:thymidylate synthase [uncultured phage]
MDLTREDKISGSVQCLKDFFQNGVHRGKNDVERECWVIDSFVKGYIDIDIPLEVLNQLRFSIILIPVPNFEWDADISSIVKIKSLNQYSKVEPWAEPMIFPYNEPTSEVKPGPLHGHRIEGKTIAETWIKILQRIKTTGTIRPTGYDGKWQELIDLMAIVTDEPKDFYFPEPNYLPLDREYLKNYIPQILDDANYREGVKYTYGQRLRSWFGQDQIEQVINKLIKEIDAASAVMSLWDVEDHTTGGSPCLNHIWVRVVDNELSLTATFRSNDMFSAWPANAMGLRALQQHIRDEIASQSEYDLTMGPLITISQSAHIYDDCWENVEQLLANQYQSIVNKEIQSYSDPTGNFLVETSGYNGYNITVSQLTPSGEFVEKWEGKNPLKLIRQIITDCPSIQSFHVGYLAREIERASQQKTNYTQDK